MSNILFITDTVLTDSIEDGYILFAQGEGHTVDTLDLGSFVAGSDAGYDCLWLGPSVSTTNNADLLASTVPLIAAYSGNYQSLGLNTNNGSYETLLTQVNILDNSHPMAAGFPIGSLTITNTPVSFRRMTGPAASAELVISTVSNTAFVFGIAIQQGDFLFDGVTVSPNRRVSYPSAATGTTGDSITVYNADGLTLLAAALSYAIGAVVVPKLEGTLTPWDTQTPAANLTGIKYSVRSDLQTSDNQVLSGTTTTNASGQFSIENAALVASTTYYVTFENAGGTVFATHKITTS